MEKNIFELNCIKEDNLRIEIKGNELDVCLNGELEDYIKENRENMLDVE